MISSAPSTPNPGSSFVASTIGAGVVVALAVGEIVEVCVMVAFTTVGMIVVIGTFRFADRLTVVVVTKLVVETTVTLSEIEGEAADEFPEDWAETETSKQQARSRRNMNARIGVRGVVNIMKGKEVTGTSTSPR
jgi:hypothetical protein